MLTIPAEIQTLLTSKLMVGDNRPTATVTIEDAPTSGSPANWDWITEERIIRGDYLDNAYQYYNGQWSGGSFVTRADGKILTNYVHLGTDVYLSTVDTEDDIFYSDNESLTNESSFLSDANGVNSRLQKLANGTILLYIFRNGDHYAEPEDMQRLEIYTSVNGLGTDFALTATIEMPLPTTTSGGGAGYVGQPIQLAIGRILIPYHCTASNSWSTQGQNRVSYSDDNGATWTTVIVDTDVHAGDFHGIGKFGTRLITFWSSGFYNGSFCLVYSDDDGESWTFGEYYTTEYIADNLHTSVFWGGDGYNYLLSSHKITGDLSGNGWWIYALEDTATYPITGQAPYDLALWGDPLLPARLGTDDHGEYAWITGAGNLALAGTNQVVSNYASHIYGGIKSEPALLPVKSITIDRSKGTASQATVVLDNKLGIYAPDSSGEWNQVIWPNKQITITLGYGAEQQLVFTGLVDEVYMSSYPAELTITARDYSKLALDQIAETTIGGVKVYSFTYANKTPEYIFTAMATQAGWAAGDIHADVTGITLTEFLTGHESIADCFQRLCEITGWEWFCDELGDVYFRAATDPAAVSVYSFTEGVDIFSLDYRISDAELYRTIVVWTSDANGSTLKASGEWPAADYNNLLAKKTLIINAGDLVTDAAGCAAMVAAESAAITPKVREVNFVAVGNPYVQIGDVIQVTETTTTISEYYRVLEISHQIGADGSPVFSTSLRCYHFAMPT